MHQLVYGRAGGTLVFASTLDMLTGHPGIARTLSPQGVFDYVFYHVSPGPQTIFKDLQRVPPGHSMAFGPQAADTPQPYWSMRFAEDHRTDQQTLEKQFIDVVQGAVEEAADGSSCGAFLSGGTDSSTVSGMLSRVGGGPARTFSIGFDVQGYDEMEYARIAAKHFGCAHHEYYVTPKDVVDAAMRGTASTTSLGVT